MCIIKFLRSLLIFLLVPSLLNAAVKQLTVTAVGNIYISSRIVSDAKKLSRTLNLISDITLANFEGVLSKYSTEEERLSYKLTMPYESATVIKQLGFNILTLNNNHALDLGVEKYYISKKQLDHLFHTAGFFDNTTVISVNGSSIRVAAYSFSSQHSVLNIARCMNQISSFSEDIIIVSMHIGDESPFYSYNEDEYFNGEPRGNSTAFSHAVIDAGADLVIGHGPHFIRGVELYKGRLIAYSLGNFIFDYPGVENVRPVSTAALKIYLEKNGEFSSADVIGFRFENGLISPDTGNNVFKILKNRSKVTNRNNALYFKINKIFKTKYINN
jgi:hypothetical protein